MAFLIIFLAMANMALGYGLAVYLGQGRLPMQISLGRFRKPTQASDSQPEETPEPPSVALEASENDDVDEPEEVAEEPAPALQVEAVVEAELDEESSVPRQVPQLDVAALLPQAQPPIESAQPEAAADISPKVAVDDRKPESTLEEDPIAEEPVADNLTAEDTTSEAETTDSAEADQVVEYETEEISESPRQEVAAQVVVDKKKINEIESLAQQLEAAVAESSEDAENTKENVEENAAQKDEENTADDEPTEREFAETTETTATETVAIDAPDEVTEAVVETVEANATPEPSDEPDSNPKELPVASEDILSGLEAFQQQLQLQAEQDIDDVAAEDSDESLVSDSSEAPEPLEEAAILEGIEAFEAQLKQQATAMD